MRETEFTAVYGLRSGGVRVLYKPFFGDDRYVMDFNSYTDAWAMAELVDMAGLTKWELMDLGFEL